MFVLHMTYDVLHILCRVLNIYKVNGFLPSQNIFEYSNTELTNVFKKKVHVSTDKVYAANGCLEL